jgi:phosphoglycerate dehydrogenase-like enzyme
MALILASARKLGEARDNQRRHHWRGMIGDIGSREDELGGKTMVIVGLGRIGSRLAALAHAFDIEVIGVKRDPSRGAGPGYRPGRVVAQDQLRDVLPEADYVVLTCPLTPATERLIDGRALRAMKPSAVLVNVARGARRRRSGAGRGPARAPDRRCSARLRRGRAARRNLSAVGHGHRADHAAHGGRNPPV